MQNLELKKWTIRGYIIYFICWITMPLCIYVAILSGKDLLRKTINLNEYIKSSSYNNELPVGQRVSFELEKAYGSFYTREELNHGRSNFAMYYYYFFIELNDGSIVALEVDSLKVKKIDAMSETTLKNEGFKKVLLEGDLVEFADPEKQIKYADYVEKLKTNNIIPSDANVRYIIITDSGSRGQDIRCLLFFGLVGLLMLLGLICVTGNRVKKKNTYCGPLNDSLKNESKDHTTSEDRKKIFDLLKNDQKIEAIDLYRKISGADLAEAKKAIEEYQKLL